MGNSRQPCKEQNKVMRLYETVQTCANNWLQLVLIRVHLPDWASDSTSRRASALKYATGLATCLWGVPGSMKLK